MYFLRAPPTKEEKKVTNQIIRLTSTAVRNEKLSLTCITVVDNWRKIVCALRNVPKRGRGPIKGETLFNDRHFVLSSFTREEQRAKYNSRFPIYDSFAGESSKTVRR